MRTFFAVLALAFSINGVAADELYTLADCHSKAVSDGGYQVQIVSGGFIGYLRAEVSERSFFGTKHLATIPVRKTNQIDGVEYAGRENNGNIIELTIDFNDGISENRYKGQLNGNIRGNIIPPTELPSFGVMSCLIPKN